MEENQNQAQPITPPQNQSQDTRPTIPAPVSDNPPAPKAKNPAWKKILMIFGGIFLGTIVLVIVIITIVSLNSKKFECTSSKGDITIMYSDDTINGYTANGIGYDLDTQKSYAESIGVEEYLEEFNDWFESNTDGTCIKK